MRERYRNSAVDAAAIKDFCSGIQTATGSQQTIAHGLGKVPDFVLIIVTNGHNGSGAGGTSFPTITEGAHTATNVLVTVTTGAQYKVYAQ